MPRQNQTTVKLSSEEILCLLNALEGTFTDHMNQDQLDTHERMIQRLDRAFGRV